jgi:hypothetical protein
MIIYINGDSFPAGSELADFLIPEWPGFLSKKQRVSLNKKIKSYEITRHERFQQYVNVVSVEKSTTPIAFFNNRVKGSDILCNIIWKREKELSWPAQLKKFDSNLEIMNNSLGGAGIAGICQRTILDIFKLKKEGTIPDIVFVQLTSTIRQEIYSIENDAFMYEMPLTEDAEFFKDEHRALVKEIMKLYEPCHYLFKYLHCLGFLNESVKSLTGKYPVLLDSVFLNQILSDIEFFYSYIETLPNNFVIHRDFQSLVDISRIKDTESRTMYEIATETEFSECPMGHLSQEVHDKFSKYIYKKYIKGFS